MLLPFREGWEDVLRIRHCNLQGGSHPVISSVLGAVEVCSKGGFGLGTVKKIVSFWISL